MNTAPLIQLNNVSKGYIKGRERVQVLQGLQLDLPPNDFISIMGPSGSGKSTLLDLLAGIALPEQGKVVIDGTELNQLPQAKRVAWRAQHIGFIFQFYHLLPVLTAQQNVELPLLLKKYSRKERQKRIDAALDLVELGNRAKHLPSELSGGEQQRVAIARAIVNNPPILLCDEPTGDLNQSVGHKIIDILENLNSEFDKTIIVVTHDQSVADRALNQYELRDGQLQKVKHGAVC